MEGVLAAFAQFDNDVRSDPRVPECVRRWRIATAIGCTRSSRWRASTGFAERILPRASDLWVQASLEQRQCLQKLFFQMASASTETALFERP